MTGVTLTIDEVDGLMAALLTFEASTTGTTKLSIWLDNNADTLGRQHAPEPLRNHS